MESIRALWNLFLFFSLLSVPQLLGVLAYFRIRQYQRFVAHLVGFLIPPILFFYFAWVDLVYLPQKIYAKEGCGMAAVAAVFILLLGTGAQIIISLLAQLMLSVRHRASVVSK